MTVKNITLRGRQYESLKICSNQGKSQKKNRINCQINENVKINCNQGGESVKKNF